MNAATYFASAFAMPFSHFVSGPLGLSVGMTPPSSSPNTSPAAPHADGVPPHVSAKTSTATTKVTENRRSIAMPATLPCRNERRQGTCLCNHARRVSRGGQVAPGGRTGRRAADDPEHKCALISVGTTTIWCGAGPYSDKRLSLGDCASFEMVDRVGIETAFTFDRDFRDCRSHDAVSCGGQVSPSPGGVRPWWSG